MVGSPSPTKAGATMSDPKPLRFAQVEEEIRSPSWIPAELTPKPPRTLEPPRVHIETIAGQATSPGLTDVLNGVAMTEAANANGSAQPPAPDPHVPREDLVAALAALQEAEARARELEAQVESLENDAASLHERFVRGTVDLATAKHEALAGAEAQLLELAVAIASEILADQLEARPELHGQLVRAGLAYFRGDDKVTLRCSPAAYDVVAESFGGKHFEAQGVHVSLVVDAGMRGAGCVLESPHRRVDARLTERLAGIRDALLAEHRHREEVGA